jgi:hypothetical protein
MPLLARTTNLCQSLGLCFFGLAAKEYRTSDKIERTLKTWHRACYRGNILPARKSGSFMHCFQDGKIVGLAVNPTLMTRKTPNKQEALAN